MNRGDGDFDSRGSINLALPFQSHVYTKMPWHFPTFFPIFALRIIKMPIISKNGKRIHYPSPQFLPLRRVATPPSVQQGRGMARHPRLSKVLLTAHHHHHRRKDRCLAERLLARITARRHHHHPGHRQGAGTQYLRCLRNEQRNTPRNTLRNTSCNTSRNTQ